MNTITIQNYPQIIDKIGINKLNAGQKEAHDLILEGSNNFKDIAQLKELMTDHDIGGMIKMYFQQLEQLQESEGTPSVPKKKSFTMPDIVKKFMPKHQQKFIYESEELQSLVPDIEAMLNNIPTKDKEGDIISAHYFYGGSDWYIKDAARGDELFGYVILNNDVEMSEWGYIGLNELVNNGRIELDFHWEPKSLAKILHKKDPDYFPDPDKESKPDQRKAKAEKRKLFVPKGRGKKREQPKEKMKSGENYLVYARPKGEKKYGAINMSQGTMVSNLMYASLFKKDELEALKERIKKIIATNEGITFQIRTAGNNQKTIWEAGKIEKAQDKQKVTAKPKAKVTAKTKAKVKKPITKKVVHKALKTKMEPKPVNTRKVFSKELQLMKRFVNLHGKVKSLTSIEMLHKVVSNALAAGQITDHKSDIEKIKSSTSNFISKMNVAKVSQAKVTIIPELLDKMKAAITGAKERLRVSYLSGAPKTYEKKNIEPMIVYDGSLGKLNIDVPEIKVRTNRSTRKLWTGSITKSDDIADFMRKTFKRGELETQEFFTVVYVDNNLKPIGYYKHSKGSITATVADQRMIIGTALKMFATGFILCHNHPSGNLTPSTADQAIIRKIAEGARLNDLRVLDHVILTKDKHYSFMDNGLQYGMLGGFKKHSGGNVEKKNRAASSKKDVAKRRVQSAERRVQSAERRVQAVVASGNQLPSSLTGFVRADQEPEKPVNTFRLPGTIGDFLGNLQRYKLAMTLSGSRGAGKTWFATDIINAFISAGYSVGFFSLEQGGMESKDTKAAIDHNILPQNRSMLAVTGEAKSKIDTVKQYADQFDLIVIDSWQKLGLPNTAFDRLRQEHPNTMWLVIFQQNAQGGQRNGNAAEFDAPIVMVAVTVDRTGRNNYVIFEKNRGNNDKMTIKYMIHDKRTEPIYDQALIGDENGGSDEGLNGFEGGPEGNSKNQLILDYFEQGKKYNHLVSMKMFGEKYQNIRTVAAKNDEYVVFENGPYRPEDIEEVKRTGRKLTVTSKNGLVVEEYQPI